MIEIEDLMQIGMIALIEAARHFEDRGLAFEPYAALRIRGAMIDQLRRDATMARAGMAARRKLAAVRTGVENRLMRKATDMEMASEMSLTASAYFAVQNSALPTQFEPIEDAYSDHDPRFAADDQGADERIEAEQIQAMLSTCIGQLEERDALVLQLYFLEELNLAEIGEVLGVGGARVCQIKKTALNRLKQLLKEAHFDPEFLP